MASKLLSFFLFFLLIFQSFEICAEKIDIVENETVIPQKRLFLGSMTVLRYNPIGFETQNRLIYRRRLIESEELLLNDTYMGAGPSLKINPVFLKLGPVFELSPLAALRFELGYEFVYYFGSLGYLQSYDNYEADFSDKVRTRQNDDSYSTHGHHWYAKVLAQAKISDWVLRTEFGFEFWNLNLKDGDGFFYDATLDTLVPQNKLVWTNDSDFLFVKDKFAAGLRYSSVFTPEKLNHHRVGPIFLWSFNTKNYSSFNRPSLFCIIAWYLSHQYRVGAVPYALVGFSFSSDFLKK